MKKVFLAKDIAEPEQYLNTMLNGMKDNGELNFAREIDDVTFCTVETEVEASHVEQVKLNVAFADYDLINNFYQNALSNLDLFISEYSPQCNVNAYCRRMVMFAKRINRLIQLNAPQIVLRIEQCMLMDSILLFKAEAKGKIAENKRVIFLDIDGVLNTPYSFNSCGNYVGIDDDKVKRLRNIVSRTDAQIVLVSDWKRGWERDGKLKSKQDFTATYLDEKLAKFGLEIADKTKDKADGTYLSRGEGIMEYIYSNDVKSFVILDDLQFDYDGCDLTDYFVRTNPQTGLTNKQVEKACQILLQ